MKLKTFTTPNHIACLLWVPIVAVQSFSALAITQFSGAVSVAVGDSHTCAAKSDGSVFCWGDNEYGK